MTPVAGVRTTFGTARFADFVPETTCAGNAERMRGGIVVGKTNTLEMSAGGNTFNEVFGATRNPWDPDLNAGGSSGGAAAGLATGAVWLSHDPTMAAATSHTGGLLRRRPVAAKRRAASAGRPDLPPRGHKADGPLGA